MQKFIVILIGLFCQLLMSCATDPVETNIPSSDDFEGGENVSSPEVDKVLGWPQVFVYRHSWEKGYCLARKFNPGEVRPLDNGDYFGEGVIITLATDPKQYLIYPGGGDQIHVSYDPSSKSPHPMCTAQ